MKKLLFVTIDSLGNDLIEKSNAKFIKEILKNGNTIKNVKTAFPSLTTPMMTTILTGKYPFEHGIYSNSVYDFEKNKVIGKLRDIKVPTISEILMEKGYKTLSVQHFMLENRCDKYIQIDGSKPENNTNSIIKELDQNNYEAIFTIYQSVDSIGHKYGAMSKKRINELEKVDSELERLYEYLNKKWGDFLLVINSDHSMSSFENHSDFSIIEFMEKFGFKGDFYEPGNKIPENLDYIIIRQPTVQIYLISKKAKILKKNIIKDLNEIEDIAEVYDQIKLKELKNEHLCDIAYTLKRGYTNNISNILLKIRKFGYHGTFEENNAIISFYENGIKKENLKGYDLTIILNKTLEHLELSIN